MIKEIHCFGTSCTAGGGFEWDSSIKRKRLEENYKEKPFTQFYYSYPGQLQELIGNDIKVFNHGKSGYGNDRMYRKVFNLIESSKSLNDKLFILEFAGLHRKEIWSNKFNKHLVANYKFNDDGTIWVTGITDRYFVSDSKIEQELKPIVEPFLKETINFEEENKLINQYAEFFVDYLLSNKINFLVVQEPQYIKTQSKIKPYTIDFGGGIYNMNNYALKHKLTITDETNGKIPNDFHGGLEWSKHVAKKIANRLKLLKPNQISIL